MRDSFIFYRSFYEALAELSQQQQTKVVMALCEYALNGKEPELKGAASAIFKLIRPQVDANNKKYENGKKGGRPVNPAEQKNQTITKAKPNHNQAITKPKPNVNVNVNVNDNVNAHVNDNDNDNALGSSGGSGSGNDDPFNIWKRMTPQDVDAIYEVYPESGGFLIDEVYAEVKAKKKKVDNPVAYILGYAKNVGWDDSADHFEY